MNGNKLAPNIGESLRKIIVGGYYQHLKLILDQVLNYIPSKIVNRPSVIGNEGDPFVCRGGEIHAKQRYNYFISREQFIKNE